MTETKKKREWTEGERKRMTNEVRTMAITEEVKDLIATLRGYNLEVQHNPALREIKIGGYATYASCGTITVESKFAGAQVNFTEYDEYTVLEVRTDDKTERVYLPKSVFAHYSYGYLILSY